MLTVEVGRRYLVLVAGVAVLFIVVFLLAPPVAVFDDPRTWSDWRGAVVGAGVLAADVVLPVPSSVVMTLHGALFGAALGAVVSLVGSVGAALAGYGLGRWAMSPVVSRVCTAQERERAAGLVRRWGVLAVVASRPVPLLAETVAVVAGAERLGLLRTAAATAVGALPAAALFALAGAYGGAAGPAGLAAFAVALCVAGTLWVSGRRRSPSTSGRGRCHDRA